MTTETIEIWRLGVDGGDSIEVGATREEAEAEIARADLTPIGCEGERCYRVGDRWLDPATGFVVASLYPQVIRQDCE